MTRVKKLQWNELKLGSANVLSAQTAIGHFEIHYSTPGHYAKDWISAKFFPPLSIDEFEDILHPNVKRLKTAKKRCQEYFEDLVYLCLEVEGMPGS